MIIHAGDIGGEKIIRQLESIAPTVYVRGNNDKCSWSRCQAETEVIEINGFYLYLLHDLDELDLDPNAAGFHMVVHGHSHRPTQTQRDGVDYINPGSCGPKRFSLPISFAKLAFGRENQPLVTFVELTS